MQCTVFICMFQCVFVVMFCVPCTALHVDIATTISRQEKQPGSTPFSSQVHVPCSVQRIYMYHVHYVPWYFGLQFLYSLTCCSDAASEVSGQEESADDTAPGSPMPLPRPAAPPSQRVIGPQLPSRRQPSVSLEATVDPEPIVIEIASQQVDNDDMETEDEPSFEGPPKEKQYTPYKSYKVELCACVMCASNQPIDNTCTFEGDPDSYANTYVYM